jgi:hypothetical protein
MQPRRRQEHEDGTKKTTSAFDVVRRRRVSLLRRPHVERAMPRDALLAVTRSNN